jgi:molybdopterin-guanine dinucleotide biosynthesis protein A
MQTMSKPEKTNISALILAGGQSRRFDYQDKGLIPIKLQFNHDSIKSSDADTAKTMVEHVLDRLTPQVNTVSISCNQNIPQYQSILQRYYSANIAFIDFSQAQDNNTDDSSDRQTRQLFEQAVCFNDIGSSDESDGSKNADRENRACEKQASKNKDKPILRGPLAGIYQFLNYCSSEWVFICPCDIPMLPDDIVQKLSKVLAESDSEVSYPVDRQGHYHLAILLKCSAGLNALENLIEDIEQSTAKNTKSSASSIRNWLARMKSEQLSIDMLESAFANINSAVDMSQFEARQNDNH